MRSLLVALLLVSLAACSEPATEPTPTTPRTPSLLTTSTSVTIDFNLGGSGYCGQPAGSTFPPLTFTDNWLIAYPSYPCTLVSDHTGTEAIVYGYVDQGSGQGFSIAAPVHTVTLWVSNGFCCGFAATGTLGVSALAADGTVLAGPQTVQLATAWTQVTLTATGNSIAEIRFATPGSTYETGAGYVALDDVTLATETGPTPSFTGFFQPVDNGGVLNIAKAGSAIPVKFSLGGDFGLNVLLKVPTASAITCPTGAGADAIEEVATTLSGLTYDAATGQYTYVWKTQSSWRGTCKQVHMPLSDGIDHTALFQFR